MPVVLQRVVDTSQGTLGQVTMADDTTLYTLERNAAGEHPRIPAGLYVMRLDVYHKGGYPAYEIIVPERSRILVHAANRAEELLGCIAPGLAIGFLAGELAVLQSRTALKRFMDGLHGAPQETIAIHDPL